MIYPTIDCFHSIHSNNGVYFKRISGSSAGNGSAVVHSIGDALAGPKNLRKLEKEDRFRGVTPK